MVSAPPRGVNAGGRCLPSRSRPRDNAQLCSRPGPKHAPGTLAAMAPGCGEDGMRDREPGRAAVDSSPTLEQRKLRMEAAQARARRDLQLIREQNAGAPGAKGGWLRASVFGINDGLL